MEGGWACMEGEVSLHMVLLYSKLTFPTSYCILVWKSSTNKEVKIYEDSVNFLLIFCEIKCETFHLNFNIFHLHPEAPAENFPGGGKYEYIHII